MTFFVVEVQIYGPKQFSNKVERLPCVVIVGRVFPKYAEDSPNTFDNLLVSKH